MNKVVGAVTIGQSPRVDVVPELQEILGLDVEIREAGALDGLTQQEIARLAPGAGDEVLVTRLADGSAVKVAAAKIHHLLERRLRALFVQGVPAVVLLCTGEFPEFQVGGLVVRPQLLLRNVVQALAGGLRVGVIVPAAEQVEQATVRWSGVGKKLIVVAASPYEDLSQLEKAAETLAEARVEMAVMDCIGYTLAMKKRVQELAKAPAILARSLVGHVLKEFLN